jgi:tetratricopeptide (TPR) repeat protein
VPRWLARARELAEQATEGTDEPLFRVAKGALAAAVGTEGELPPDAWLQLAEQTCGRLIQQSADPARRRHLEWELGLVLYDGLQVLQMRSEHQQALAHGLSAVEHLKRGAEGRDESPGDAYVIGRLYFRVGSIYAIHEQNHASAVEWFDRAAPLMERPIPASALADVGRQGGTFVSMGVSYWEVGQHDEALRLTRQGVHLLEQQVREQSLAERVLATPYANLARMYRALGNEQEAESYAKLAAKTDPVEPAAQPRE